MNSEAYAQASGTMLETYLAASSPFRDAQKKLMVSALEQLNMPSRADFVSLAERLANLEMFLDDMDAKLSQIYGSQQPSRRHPVPKAESEPSHRAPKLSQIRSLRPRPNQKRSP